MTVSPFILNAAAFIGKDGQQGFIPFGTCFFLEISEEQSSFVYAITCRHLVGQATHLRLGRKNKPPMLIDVQPNAWLCPDGSTDLAIVPFDSARWDADSDLRIAFISVPSAVWSTPPPTNFFMAPGAELVIPSLFTPHPGELDNIPILRRATIAAMPREPLRYASPVYPSYLIESRSLGGSSGSPVFVNLRPNDPATPMNWIDASGSVSLPLLLIGMITASHAGDYADEFATTEEKRSTADSQFNAGISVVMPVEVIMSFVLSNTAKAFRKHSPTADPRKSAYISTIGSSRDAPAPHIVLPQVRRPPTNSE